MKTSTKILGFICVCVLLGVIAKTIPHKQISIVPLDAAQSSQTITATPTVDLTNLLRRYKSRSLFIPKFANDAGTMDKSQMTIVEDWSPLDYKLIGISRTNGKTTGWFKHVETGDLTSGRQGMQLGNWTLDYLSSIEAKLSSEGKTESLKLFQGGEPR